MVTVYHVLIPGRRRGEWIDDPEEPDGGYPTREAANARKHELNTRDIGAEVQEAYRH